MGLLRPNNSSYQPSNPMPFNSSFVPMLVQNWPALTHLNLGTNNNDYAHDEQDDECVWSYTRQNNGDEWDSEVEPDQLDEESDTEEYNNGDPQIFLSDMVILATQLPQLITLQIFFILDPTGLPFSKGMNTSIRRLGVACGGLGGEKVLSVAHFLRRVFPRLNKLRYHSGTASAWHAVNKKL